MNEEAMTEEEEKEATTTIFRKSFRQSLRKSGVASYGQGSAKKL
jgi:hypothetical protein